MQRYLITVIISLAGMMTCHALTEFQILSASFDATSGYLAGNGIVTTSTVPETNEWIPSYVNADAVNVNLSNPHIAMGDALGNTYIADKASHQILKVGTNSKINVFAGTGFYPFTTTYPYSSPANYVVADGPAPATSLNLKSCNGLYALPNGVVYIYDAGNHRIRRVGLDGIMTTIINDPDPLWLPSGRGLWVSPTEDLIYYVQEVADMSQAQPTTGVNRFALGGVVKKWTPAGGIQAITRYPSAPTRALLELTNPGNIDVHPITHKLYVTDRAEDDANTSFSHSTVWRIDAESTNPLTTACTKTQLLAFGPPANASLDSTDTGNLLAVNASLNQVRGIAFTPNGGYFLCSHRGGNVWYVDSDANYLNAHIHLILRGRGKNDITNFSALTLPVTAVECHSQPREITLAPDGSLLVVSNDSGIVRKIKSHQILPLPTLQNVIPHANQFHFTWTSNNGQSYVIERSPTLQADTWQVAGVVTATSSLANFLEDTTTQGPRNFYRITPPR
jgi:hypothetical protein